MASAVHLTGGGSRIFTWTHVSFTALILLPPLFLITEIVSQ